MRVENSDFIAKRVAAGGYGPEPDSKLATALHRFIYEYDDADPYRSAWFLHRLELVLNELRAQTSADRDKADAERQLRAIVGNARGLPGEPSLMVVNTSLIDAARAQTAADKGGET